MVTGDVVDSHPDVIAEREAYQSALADLDKRAGTTTTLALSSIFSVGYLGQQHCGKIKCPNAISLTLSAPIYTSGVASAKGDVAKAGVVKAEADLLNCVVLANMQKPIGTRPVHNSGGAQLAIISAASRVEATEAAYAVGSGDIVEVLNSKKDLFAAERDFAKARHTHVVRQLQFDRAVGDLSESAIARIDQSLTQ